MFQLFGKKQDVSSDEADPWLKGIEKAVQGYVDIHDQAQIEAVFSYATVAADAELPKKTKPRSFEVDLYVLFPQQLKLAAVRYPKKSFYQDLKYHLRLKEPSFGFQQLLGKKKKHEEISPLAQLRKYVDEAEAVSAEDSWEVLTQAQLFACSYFGYFSRMMKKRRKALARLRDSDSIDTALMDSQIEEIETAVNKAQTLVSEWREIEVKLRDKESILPATFVDIVRLVDEYCTYAFSERLLDLLGDVSAVRAKSDQPQIVKIYNLVEELFRKELEYGEGRGYLWISSDQNQETQEEILHRRRSLKRQMWSVLYLDLSYRRGSFFNRHFGPMLAAGLAAIWAGIANILILSYIGANSENFSATRIIWGVNGTLIIGASAFAYILKDRIKEVGRSMFNMKSKNYDHSFDVLYHMPNGKTEAIGKLYEGVDNMRPHETDPLAYELFKKFSIEPILPNTGHRVQHYRRSLSLVGKRLMGGALSSYRIFDIVRFNLHRFLPLLDSSNKVVLGMNEEGHVEQIAMPRIYYFDVIVHYKGGSDAAQDIVKYLRYTVSAEGLKEVKMIYSDSDSNIESQSSGLTNERPVNQNVS